MESFCLKPFKSRRSASMNLRLSYLVVFLLIGPPATLAQCSADADNTFKPFKGGENNPSGHFEWDSEAGPNHDKGGGHPDYAVERNVKNFATTTLKYRWAVGRLHNDALAGPKPDHNCYETTWPNQNAGPLEYGRGNDHTDTKVWEGLGEPKENAIWASFTLNIATAGSVRTLSMRVLSSYSKISEGSFSYNYLFESVSGGTVTLRWGVDKIGPL